MNEDKKADDGFTISGTNIADVKRQNEHSGLTYNEIKEVLAKTMVGKKRKT